MCEEIVDAIRNNTPEMLQHTHDIDINVDKFHDYCIRVLNKTAFKESRQSHLLFSTIYLLEILGDECKNISRHILEDMQGKSLRNLLPLSELILEQFNKFYNLYYNFQKRKTL